MNVGRHMGKPTAIKAMGIKIALDDFGTGYLSPSYLSHLPVDQSFVKHLEDDRTSRAITIANIFKRKV
jgi:EAL domain-containing protein (putative c-di-GMP-specific phosphodiesterase class I)